MLICQQLQIKMEVSGKDFVSTYKFISVTISSLFYLIWFSFTNTLPGNVLYNVISRRFYESITCTGFPASFYSYLVNFIDIIFKEYSKLFHKGEGPFSGISFSNFDNFVICVLLIISLCMHAFIVVHTFCGSPCRI